MRDYVELVKELRYCGDRNNLDCKGCSRKPTPICDDELKSDAADAIEELLAAAPTDHTETINALSEDVNDALALVRERETRINELVARNKELESAVPKWISVEERLPEVDQSVLFCAFGRAVGEGTYRGHDEFHHVWKMYAVAGTYWDDEVTHWMPLPKAPKEDAE